jgi:hypothetical protein
MEIVILYGDPGQDVHESRNHQDRIRCSEGLCELDAQ